MTVKHLHGKRGPWRPRLLFPHLTRFGARSLPALGALQAVAYVGPAQGWEGSWPGGFGAASPLEPPGVG